MNTSLIDFNAIERILLKAPVDWRVKEIQALAFLFIELRGVIANDSHLAKFVRSRLGSLKRRGQPRKDGLQPVQPECELVLPPFREPEDRDESEDHDESKDRREWTMRKDQALSLLRHAINNDLGLIQTQVWRGLLQPVRVRAAVGRPGADKSQRNEGLLRRLAYFERFHDRQTPRTSEAKAIAAMLGDLFDENGRGRWRGARHVRRTQNDIAAARRLLKG